MIRGTVFARLARVSVALTLVAAGGVWWYAARKPPPIGVVIITLDTTRADRLSPYGYMNVSLPNLERLAREGVVFDQATSVAPLTLPAHASLFTGLRPPNHGVRDNSDRALADSQHTLAETLLARGFRTGAFVGSIVLNPERGLKQGFEQYVGVAATDQQTPESRQRRADEVIGDAVRWLDTVGQSPYLLWTHLYDPHRPYDPPEPYRSTYAHNPYVGEIAFVDSQIGRLLEALEQRRLLDRTIVIVAGDHGESLGAHGERDHGIFVYEDVLRVPLIVRAPGLQPARVEEIVRLTDVMPTVLNYLNIPFAGADGVSLVELMTGRRQGLKLEAYSESLYPERLGWSPLYAVRDGAFKLIDAPRPELYDLHADPTEETNIYANRPAIVESLKRRLALLAKASGTASAVDRAGVTPQLQAQLASLGYVSSSIGRAPSNPARLLLDPKDCIGAYSRTPDRSPVQLPACGPLQFGDDGFTRPPPPPSSPRR